MIFFLLLLGEEEEPLAWRHASRSQAPSSSLRAMMTGVTVWYRDNGRLTRAEVVELYLGAALQSVGLVAETP